MLARFTSFLIAAAVSGSVWAASYSEAQQMFYAGKYAECIEACDEAIERYPWVESWRQLKIDSQLATGQYGGALVTLDAAIKSHDTSIRLRFSGHKIFLFNGRPIDAQRMFDEIDKLTDGQQWRYRGAADQITLGQYFLLRGGDAKQILEVFYDQIKKRQPTNPDTYLATGQLALDKHDYALAAESYQQAVKLMPGNPDVHLGLAKSYLPSDGEAAEAAIATALELNPRHVGSLLVTVDRLVDSELYDQAHTTLDQILEIHPRQPDACAYRAVLAHLDGNSLEESVWRRKALSTWSANPAVDHVIGTKLSQKYRFAEGAAHQRQALRFNPDYLPAKIQLCQDLLRLGEEDEGWQLAASVYQGDGYNVVAHNLVTLQKTLSKFHTLASDGFLLRMESREADIYGHAALDLLEEAKRTLCAKYDVQLDRRIAVEIFPEQKDFAVRTFGMPGGAGFLGVCFGPVITANSPASQGERPSNWKAVLWHEFCHVVTLHKTRNKMPRWLSEGISVYEERQANPAWGQSMDAQYREMILRGQLTPVSRLSSAFLRPPSPLYLQFAYYESSLVVEYIVDKYGLEALKDVLGDLADDVPINAALARHTVSLDTLDEQFAVYAVQQAETLAGDADWETPELPPDADLDAITQWNEQHPNSLIGLRLLATAAIGTQRWEEAKSSLQQLIRLYPDSIDPDSPYRVLAGVHRELDEYDDERDVLEQLAALDCDAIDVYRRLMELCEESEDWEGLARNAERMLAVNPLLRAPHRLLARAAECLDASDRAVQAYRALVHMDPVDPAETHYRLARLLKQQGDLTGARRQVLMALDEAPRFRDAHRLLLELVEPPATTEAPDTDPTRETKR